MGSGGGGPWGAGGASEKESGGHDRRPALPRPAAAPPGDCAPRLARSPHPSGRMSKLAVLSWSAGAPQAARYPRPSKKMLAAVDEVGDHDVPCCWVPLGVGAGLGGAWQRSVGRHASARGNRAGFGPQWPE